MDRKLSRKELVAIAAKLMAEGPLKKSGGQLERSDVQHLIEDFEAAFSWPYAADLIRNNRHEFNDAVECVEFLLGEEKPRRLSREELVEVARRLMSADVRNEVDTARLGSLFAANVPHPDGTDLIFYPKIEFETPEALIDFALSYKPLEN